MAFSLDLFAITKSAHIKVISVHTLNNCFEIGYCQPCSNSNCNILVIKHGSGAKENNDSIDYGTVTS